MSAKERRCPGAGFSLADHLAEAGRIKPVWQQRQATGALIRRAAQRIRHPPAERSPDTARFTPGFRRCGQIYGDLTETRLTT